MDRKLVYVPVFRGLQEEIKVLKSFNFKDRVYPCIEIVKELDRLPQTSKKPKANSNGNEKTPKTFEDVYIPLIRNIKAQKVIIDLPIQVKEHSSMKRETILFLKGVVANREKRTEYLKKLSPLRNKVIPVISSYYSRTNERNSILRQFEDLKNHFDSLAFRTSSASYDSFSRDITQIESVISPKDYLIVDWEDNEMEVCDDNSDIVEKLGTLNCTTIIHKNSISKLVTNSGLDHGKIVTGADNGLLDTYRDLGADCFSDYCGIKKHNLGKGGSISPGFIYYDAVRNKFYGFKSELKELGEFSKTIVPAILSSAATRRMNEDELDFLSQENIGWKIVNNIKNNLEPGASAAKFKRIGMEHYLHCLQTKILNGDFD